MIVRRTINKDEVKELPRTVFPGRIYVIQSETETEKAVAYLQSRSVIGIDSETRPSFTKGQSHKVALLQISSEECCFLFRLNMTGLTRFFPQYSGWENKCVSRFIRESGRDKSRSLTKG